MMVLGMFVLGGAILYGLLTDPQDSAFAKDEPDDE